MDNIILQDHRIAIGLSGGVDSAVAAYLLKKEGHDVTGVYMQCWNVREDGCTSEEDRAYAIKNASKLDIKFITLDFREAYRKKVIDYFYSEYKKGRTPNPDVMCNKEIKFGLFYDWALKNNFDAIATGHYARVKNIKSKKDVEQALLLQGIDYSKDQSYFLYRMNQKVLSKVKFPIGDLKKQEVRKIAIEQNLPSAKRAESMGICFIGEVDIRRFLEKEIAHKTGTVVDLKGNTIGEHSGVWFYTIGQRHGYTIYKYSSDPLYVVGKDVEKNILIVGSEEDSMKKEFKVAQASWINETPTGGNYLVRIRHLGEMYPAEVSVDSTGDSFSVLLEKPAFGVTPGQSCVVYDNQVVLGGGIIE